MALGDKQLLALTHDQREEGWNFLIDHDQYFRRKLRWLIPAERSALFEEVWHDVFIQRVPRAYYLAKEKYGEVTLPGLADTLLRYATKFLVSKRDLHLEDIEALTERGIELTDHAATAMLERSVTGNTLKTLLVRLDLDELEVVLGLIVQTQSVSECARKTNLSRHTVTKLYKSALGKMRTEADRQGIVFEDFF